MALLSQLYGYLLVIPLIGGFLLLLRFIHAWILRQFVLKHPEIKILAEWSVSGRDWRHYFHQESYLRVRLISILLLGASVLWVVFSLGSSGFHYGVVVVLLFPLLLWLDHALPPWYVFTNQGIFIVGHPLATLVRERFSLNSYFLPWNRIIAWLRVDDDVVELTVCFGKARWDTLGERPFFLKRTIEIYLPEGDTADIMRILLEKVRA